MIDEAGDEDWPSGTTVLSGVGSTGAVSSGVGVHDEVGSGVHDEVGSGVHAGVVGSGVHDDVGSGVHEVVVVGSGVHGVVSAVVVGSGVYSLVLLTSAEVEDELVVDVVLVVLFFFVVDGEEEELLDDSVGAGGRSTAGAALARAHVVVLPAKISAAARAAPSRRFIGRVLPGRESSASPLDDRRNVPAQSEKRPDQQRHATTRRPVVAA